MGPVQRALVLVMGLLLLGGAWGPARAQQGGGLTGVAWFQEASALAVDPSGRLYVADVGRDVVRIFDAEGVERTSLGGSGIRAGEFDTPMDVDPTNGQTLLVADAGNGRVQRFTEEGKYLEALPVGRAFGEPDQRVFDDGRDGGDVQGEGRPIAVATSDGGDLFVVDARDDAVLTFDAQRRPERIIGPARGPRRPVALAVDGSRRLYVADADQRAVFAYDLFGGLIERLPLPALPAPRALAMHRGRLWIVCADRIVLWDPQADTAETRPVDLPAPLVDAARQGTDLLLLTERRLLRRPF